MIIKSKYSVYEMPTKKKTGNADHNFPKSRRDNRSKDPQTAGLSDRELVVLQHQNNNFAMMHKIF